MSDDPRELDAELELEEGWVAAPIAEEFPDLRLWSTRLAGGTGRSPRGVRERLSRMSDRFKGAHAIELRREPVPSAYRVFFRHVGLDPDAQRTPVEEAAVQRLVSGGFQSQNLLDDAVLVALMETGVPLWGLDAATVDGPLGLRVASDGERLGRGEEPPPARGGALVVADAESPLATLFEPVAPGHAVTKRTSETVLFTVQVPGVPAIFVEEAFWACAGVLAG